MSSSSTPSAAPATMKYTLNSGRGPRQPASLRTGIKRFAPLVAGEKPQVILAVAAITISSVASLVAPVLIAHTIDTYIRLQDASGLLRFSLLVLAVYLAGVVASYVQIRTMGGVGRRVLFHVRNGLFLKLQELPVVFFNQNKAGDLISRLNNDTDKLNQFVSQALMQFVGSIFLMTGAAVFLLSLNIRLGAAALLPALGVLIFSRSTSAWIKAKNMKSLQTLGGMSSEVQESLNNFKVIVAFNRSDYFRQKFNTANDHNFKASMSSGFANGVLMPLYGFSSHLAQLLVVAYGIYLIGTGAVTVGLLIGFLLYVNSFYGPLRQLATVWSSFQLALASMDRISEVMGLESDMPVITAGRVAIGIGPGVSPGVFSLSRREQRSAGHQLRAGTGQGVRTGGSHGRRQDHHGSADGAAVRSHGRIGPAEWARYPFLYAGGARPEDRIHSAGALPVQRQRAGQRCFTATKNTGIIPAKS